MHLFLRSTLILIVTAAGALAHSSAFSPAHVDALLVPYFEMQEALVKDKFEPAVKAAASYADTLAAGPSAKEAPSVTKLAAAAKAIKEAPGIEAARKAFHSLSNEMIMLVDHVGTAKTTVYQMRCTMAFNNTGASWLQATDKLYNPYWGARMLRCGHEETVYKPKK